MHFVPSSRVRIPGSQPQKRGLRPRLVPAFDRSLVRRLVETHLTAAWQDDRRLDSELGVRYFCLAKPLGLQLFDSCIEVVAHQVQDRTEQIMACVTLREIRGTAMSGHLRGRQREDQSLISR